MSELSEWVSCLQDNNTQVFAPCSGYVHCAKTVVPVPPGKIKRVYTISNGQWCDKVYYRSRTFSEVEVWARELMVNWTTPESASLPDLQEGFANPSSSTDSKFGRALLGIWAIHRSQLYVTPWLQSNESLVIEWDGPKAQWDDDDVLDEDLWGIPEKEAIRAFVKWKHELYFGCDRQRTKDFEMEFRDQLAMLIHTCEDRIYPDIEENVPDIQRFQTAAEATAAEIPTAQEATIVVGNIGDYGSDLQSEQQVADLVDTFGADFVVSNGDNNYGLTQVGGSNRDASYDQYVGKYYSKWIFPYTGAYEKVAEENLFWPVPGNHDFDVDASPKDLRSYLNFFSGLPGNKRFYEFVRGAAHFFMLNSQPQEPDGNGPTSVQAQWFKARAALSTANWKIAVIHDAPFTSANGDRPGLSFARWDFSDVDLVLSGDSHGFERLESNGKPYIVNGAGGANLDQFTAIPESKFIYRGYGAGKMTISCNELAYEFFDVSGSLLDTLTLRKE